MEKKPFLPKWITEALENNKALQDLNHGRDIPSTSLMEEALIISASFQKEPRPILVVKQNLYNAQRLYDRLSALVKEDRCALFGADESLRVEAIASSPEMTAIKVDTLSSLLQNPNQIVVTCPSALLRYLPLPEVFQDCSIDLHTGQEADMKQIRERLIAGGYEQTGHVDHPLSFAMRGGIIDVYSINYDQPIRIEFFDTEIESIRYFDPVTQKTIALTDDVHIIPASDVIFSDEQIHEITQKARRILSQENNEELTENIESNLDSLEKHVIDRSMYPYMALCEKVAGIWDYMQYPVILLSDEQLIHESVKRLQDETIAYLQEMVQENKWVPKYTVWHDYQHFAARCHRVNADPFAINTAGIEETHLPNEPLEKRIRIAASQETVILAIEGKELLRVQEACKENAISFHLLSETETPITGLNIYPHEMPQGFYIAEKNLYVYTAAELFEIHHHAGRYENKFRSAEIIHGFDDLEPGDYIVHAQYGVGQYVGIETREIQDIKRDFLKIVYRGNAELLVPLEQFRLVRKFVSREGVVPRLNKLGSGEWEKTKKRLEENVNHIAERLLKLYANREQHIGFAFSKDNELTTKFENSFPYELTDDQRKAVKEIKKDMESDKPMDRLVCGDVGFGKTEVAVRASFKAVSDNKQVAVLCPTTILSQQHFRTFSDRYKSFPVTVKVLNRFVPDSEQKKILKDVKEGKVDILIGTHRLLSNDVQFKDLGLLIVDEEQRFGVEHKEKIKELKNGVDVLALSATPIPRTLQMSLIGIRSLSQLETPPLNRYSVQTYVVEKTPGLVIDAIQKELARDGQVFYVYNNIERIYNIARTLRHELPDASIGIVHGKMDRNEIEDVMMKFNAHEIDVLVCTTIVENGIDIPNVNTILIDNAQDFGLSQIYQIKGRVGRSNRIAYAYLLIPPRRQLSEVAQKRLQAVKEFARLGSGYKIAMRDLTIRGAGDLLGPDQSGFIDTVGIDMYIEMLEEAIREKKTGVSQSRTEPEARPNVHRTSYIPDGFAANDFDKLELYQKIDQAEDSDSLNAYETEIIDQYGKLPKEVKALFEKKQLDIRLKEPIVQSYRELKNRTEITFSTLYSQNVDGVRLFESFTKLSRDITIRYQNGTIITEIPNTKDTLNLAVRVVDLAKEARKNANR